MCNNCVKFVEGPEDVNNLINCLLSSGKITKTADGSHYVKRRVSNHVVWNVSINSR